MTFAIIAAYLIGASLGLTAARSPRLARVWPMIVRSQILATSVVLAIIAAWRLTGLQDIVWPLLMIAAVALMLVVSLLTTDGERRLGRATLRSWAASPNSGFFAIPVAAALVGPGGTLVAALFDRFGAPLWATYTWMLRRDAPKPQRTSTSWIDQSPLIALGVGLVLRFLVAPPEWTLTVTAIAAPVMAASGSAIFVGSVLHSSQRIDPRPGVWPWLSLVLLRIVLFGGIVLIAPTPTVAVVALLCALTIPAFGPPQMSTVYGYAEPVVAASARYSWIVGAVGLVAAIWYTR